MIEVLAAQLVTLRAQIGGLQANVEAMQQTLEAMARQAIPVGPEPCAHLETELDPRATLGNPVRRCANPVCRAIVS